VLSIIRDVWIASSGNYKEGDHSSVWERFLGRDIGLENGVNSEYEKRTKSIVDKDSA
jgi:hypothetical protein